MNHTGNRCIPYSTNKQTNTYNNYVSKMLL